MPNLTTKLGLNTWLENEVMDVDQLNANFEKLDSMVMCLENEKKTANYTGGSDTVVTWHYRKHSDGTVDLWTKLSFSSLKCNGGSAFPYYSEDVKIYLPFSLSAITDVQMHLASGTIGWICDVTGKGILDYLQFRVMSTVYESTTLYKEVFINVKGVLS